ncbi:MULTISPECIES: MerR family transcriptional regulator [Nocardiopsis]|uniref:DNA-binding transcriptional MerR regulator n=1 Tax=Nocardiopsis sinuspersici TaxID=501010 RepID=A0A1V3C4A3_9ACTN|nr:MULTISPECIES: MerR family transcriptional regulator [Nocardiopsis]NYH52077.1 DNA-binding transcriptional MerR regulator [Nocardiopsis sinuspersici]OOC55624.1 MerR family transcriptional regulator [Nocardiopsis sinuspersici]
MKSRERELSIGELAEPFGLATHVLRHWEAAGVLEPARRSGGQRRYTPEHQLQVALVLRAQEAGFSLAQIREVVGASDGAARRALLTEHLAGLDERLERLRSAREMVAHVVACESGDFLKCPTMRAMLEETAMSECAATHGRTRSPSLWESPWPSTTT